MTILEPVSLRLPLYLTSFVRWPELDSVTVKVRTCVHNIKWLITLSHSDATDQSEETAALVDLVDSGASLLDTVNYLLTEVHVVSEISGEQLFACIGVLPRFRATCKNNSQLHYVQTHTFISIGLMEDVASKSRLYSYSTVLLPIVDIFAEFIFHSIPENMLP